MKRLVMALGIVSISLMACGDVEPLSGENYGDLITSPSGLTLTEGEHTIGWGKSNCFTCHEINNIHLVDHSGLGFDMEAIRDQTFTEGLTSCATCHGTNGAP